MKPLKQTEKFHNAQDVRDSDTQETSANRYQRFRKCAETHNTRVLKKCQRWSSQVLKPLKWSCELQGMHYTSIQAVTVKALHAVVRKK